MPLSFFLYIHIYTLKNRAQTYQVRYREKRPEKHARFSGLGCSHCLSADEAETERARVLSAAHHTHGSHAHPLHHHAAGAVDALHMGQPPLSCQIPVYHSTQTPPLSILFPPFSHEKREISPWIYESHLVRPLHSVFREHRDIFPFFLSKFFVSAHHLFEKPRIFLSFAQNS